MKKLMTVLGLVGMVGGSVAGAQTWDTNLGKLTLAGCFGKQDGVYCDFSFVLTKKQTAVVEWNNSDFKVFTQDGTSQIADGMGFVDGKVIKDGWKDSEQHEIIAGVPTKVTAYFNTPSATPSFRAIVFNNQKFDNIPVRPYGAAAPASAPAVASNGWTTVTNPPFPTAFNIGNFKGTFNKCQMQGGTYICGAIINHK